MKVYSVLDQRADTQNTEWEENPGGEKKKKDSFAKDTVWGKQSLLYLLSLLSSYSLGQVLHGTLQYFRLLTLMP